MHKYTFVNDLIQQNTIYLYHNHQHLHVIISILKMIKEIKEMYDKLYSIQDGSGEYAITVSTKYFSWLGVGPVISKSLV